MTSARKRIFQIGFNRCGTTSLYEFFKSNGIPSLHWEGGRIAISFFARMQRNEDPFLDYPDNIFFCDMMAIIGNEKKVLQAHQHFEYIFKFYPDSYYILNTRSCEHWLASRWDHAETRDGYRQCAGLDGAELMEYWRKEWSAHHDLVLDFFRSNRGKLVVFDIEKDSAESLTRFLEADFRLDASVYGRHNATFRPSFARRFYWRLVALAKRFMASGA